MNVGRSRMQEYFNRVLREDMLTSFNNVASLKSIECSVVLQGTQTMSDEVKYRAAVLLELLTGNRPFVNECDVMREDPVQRSASETEKRELEKARGAFIREAMMGNRKGGPRPDPSAVSQQMKKMGNGLKIVSHMHRVNVFYFLEKLREFYLPDVMEGGTVKRDSWRPLPQGHDNTLERKGLSLLFEKKGGSIKKCYPSRYPVTADENPHEAITCYTLKSTDLLKFPDVELHFEALGPIVGGKGDGGQTLQLILRPELIVESPMKREMQNSIPPVDRLRIMNSLLSQFFNSYLTRPTLH